jgi:hypothetical protein
LIVIIFKADEMDVDFVGKLDEFVQCVCFTGFAQSLPGWDTEPRHILPWATSTVNYTRPKGQRILVGEKYGSELQDRAHDDILCWVR